MTDQLCGIEAEKAFHEPFTTLGVCALKVMPEGLLGTTLFWVLVLWAAPVPFVFRYYIGVLAQGAEPEGSLERQDYVKLRASLAGDNLAAWLYAEWLTAFLDGVERFFGDVGMANRTLFPRAFGLKKPAPLWTAPAFDRCLLLALLYPIFTIFVIWAVSGHVGPAEDALGLKPDVPGAWRGQTAAAIGFSCFAYWRGVRARAWKSRVWIAVGVGVAVFAGVAGAFAFAFAVAGTFAFTVAVAVTLSVSDAVAFTVVVAFGLAFAGLGAVAVAFGVAFAGVGAVAALSALAIKHRLQGVFLSLFLPAMVLVCFAAAAFLSPLPAWDVVGPLLLFMGLLTLVNAPFDWASLGLTRALLRRGLELGGWSPYLLALVDAVLAGVIIACLAIVMVVGVQAFDELAVHGGGEKAAVLPLPALFDGMAKNLAAPEYWWVYALLLSTMVPSLINLAIAGMALTRGIPRLGRILLQWIPEGKAVPEYKRQPAAIVLTAQMFAGAGLGIAAQVFLVWGLIAHVMPWAGLGLLDMARAVAAFDVPTWIGTLFAGVA
jgi:hypothetical protein